MLAPKKVKHRKWQTGRRKIEDKIDVRGSKISFGSFGIKAMSSARVTSNQIEAARKACQRELTKAGRVWIRIFPDRPVTQKAANVGMGKGKGDLDHYCFEVLSGRIIFEVDGVPEEKAREALRKAGTKLPIKTKVVSRELA
jgi:large subunit ribosomal protein L16